MIEQYNIANNNVESKYKKEKQNRLGITWESGKGRTESRKKFGHNHNNTIHTVNRESGTEHVKLKSRDFSAGYHNTIRWSNFTWRNHSLKKGSDFTFCYLFNIL